MKNIALALATLLMVVTAGCAVVFSGYLGTNPSSEPNMTPVEEKLHLEKISVVKNNECVNVSLTIKGNFNEAVPVNECRINGVLQNELSNLTIYLNGSSIVITVSPLFVVENGYNLLVNFVLPHSFSDGIFNTGCIKINIATPDALYYIENA